MRRTFWTEGWKAAAHDDSRVEGDPKTSLTLSTAEAPLFSFLGKSRFEFYSNDTVVLGLQRTEAAASQHSKSSTHGSGGGRDAHPLGYKAPEAPDHKFSIFKYNYDADTNKAVDDIVLLQSGASSITCKDCYLYGGWMRST